MKSFGLAFQMNGRHLQIQPSPVHFAAPARRGLRPPDCRNYQLMVQNRGRKRGAKLRRDTKRSAWSWLKKVILEENVKGVDIRLHSWREEERERDRESATLFRPEQMESLDTGGKAIGYSFFSFSFLFACFYDFGGFEICDQVPDLPRNMEWRPKKRCSVRGKKTNVTQGLLPQQHS